ncbi:hypothetical protein AX14_001861 [Amanita brunnescens Koide BX004]|nr:hypothetical protein AX14_001861 [Amanita brunnescens Koide BX004]
MPAVMHTTIVSPVPLPALVMPVLLPPASLFPPMPTVTTLTPTAHVPLLPTTPVPVLPALSHSPQSPLPICILCPEPLPMPDNQMPTPNRRKFDAPQGGLVPMPAVACIMPSPLLLPALLSVPTPMPRLPCLPIHALLIHLPPVPELPTHVFQPLPWHDEKVLSMPQRGSVLALAVMCVAAIPTVTLPAAPLSLLEPSAKACLSHAIATVQLHPLPAPDNQQPMLDNKAFSLPPGGLTLMPAVMHVATVPHVLSCPAAPLLPPNSAFLLPAIPTVSLPDNVFPLQYSVPAEPKLLLPTPVDVLT